MFLKAVGYSGYPTGTVLLQFLRAVDSAGGESTTRTQIFLLIPLFYSIFEFKGFSMIHMGSKRLFPFFILQQFTHMPYTQNFNHYLKRFIKFHCLF